MTRIEKSESQNIAEASAPLEERDLEAAIELHRILYAADLSWLHKLHVRDGESGIGVPFSPAFEALLDGRLGGFPWSRALRALHTECRRSHSEHWEREEWGGSLCYRLISLTCRFGWSYEATCFELYVTPEKTLGPMFRGLRFIESKMQTYDRTQRQVAQPARTPAEWMAPAYRHQPLDGLHATECIQCLRRRVAA